MFILNAQKSFEIPLFKMGHLVKLLLWQMAPNSSVYKIAWCLILAFLAIYENAIFHFFLGTVWVETCHRHGRPTFFCCITERVRPLKKLPNNIFRLYFSVKLLYNILLGHIHYLERTFFTLHESVKNYTYPLYIPIQNII